MGFFLTHCQLPVFHDASPQHSTFHSSLLALFVGSALSGALRQSWPLLHLLVYFFGLSLRRAELEAGVYESEPGVCGCDKLGVSGTWQE